MGFLDREREIEEKDAEKERFIRAVSAGNVTKPTFDSQRQDDLSRGPEDNAKISELLDNLPEFQASFNSGHYLWKVEEHTGYKYRVCLYTRDKGFRETDQNLRNKLFHFYQYVDEDHPLHPEEMFCGEDIKPAKGFLFPRPISEPQEPGIGIHFSKKLSCLREYNGKYNLDIFTYPSNHVFVRFILPSTAFITGSGISVAVTSLEHFDNALEDGFRNPHRKMVRQVTGHDPGESG